MNVAVVAEETPGAMAARASLALARGADMVELRLDRLPQGDLDALPLLARDFGPRALATLRSTDEGGGCTMDRGKRARTLRELVDLGFATVDVELLRDEPFVGKLRELAEAKGIQILVSAHPSPSTTPAAVEALLRRACSLGHRGKVAIPVDDTARALELVAVHRRVRADFPGCTLIAMGPAGQVTRARGEATGSCLNYVVPPGATAIAPGQLTLDQARAMGEPGALLLGLLGHPIAHSLSPAMQNAALGALGLPGLYVPLDVPPDHLADFFAEVPALGLAGFNVTIPHKEAVVPFLDELDPTAEELGAVNTVAVEGGRLRGYNTDPHGFAMLLREARVKVDGQRVLVLGAGGAARAAVLALQARGAHVEVHNRTAARAEALARRFPGVAVVEAGDLRPGRYAVVVNCTPAGTEGQGSWLPLPAGLLGPGLTVVDLVYNPPETPLLREARGHGARPVGGLSMLVHQGAAALELWTGKAPPLEAMGAAAREALA